MPGPGITYPNTGPTWGSITGNPMYDATAGLFDAPGNPMKMLPSIGLWGPQVDPGAWAAYNQAYWTNPANHPEAPPVNPPKPWNTPPTPQGNIKKKIGTGTNQPPPPASGGSLPYVASSLIPRAPSGPDLSGLTYLGSPGANIGEFTIPNFQPTSSAPVTTGVTKSSTLPNPYSGYLQGSSLPLNTAGTNPYLTDPLMASYYGMQNPNFQQSQQDFYGDPELYSAPSVGRATGGG